MKKPHTSAAAPPGNAPKPPVVAAVEAEDDAVALMRRALNGLQEDQRRLEVKRKGEKVYNERTGGAQRLLADKIALIHREARQVDTDELAAVRAMGATERFPIVMMWLLEQTVSMRRDALTQLEASLPKIAS